nr:TPA_asm: hypothetical protein [Orchesella springtail adintovirus]
MAKRYKLVPESLYRQLMKPSDEEGHEVRLEHKRDSILNQNIPDDIKVLLYSNAARDLQLKRSRRRQKPILVKNIDTEKAVDTPKISLASLLNNKKGMDLNNFLNQNKITHNDQMEIVINGSVVPNTSYPMMIKGIQNNQVGLQPGMLDVLKSLTNIPDGLYSKPVIAKYMPSLMPKLTTPKTSPKTKLGSSFRANKKSWVSIT